MPEEIPIDDKAINALTVFTMKYSPATIKTVTDQFSSKEILRLLHSHLGKEIISLAQLHDLLLELKYEFILNDNEFVWLCKTD